MAVCDCFGTAASTLGCFLFLLGLESSPLLADGFDGGLARLRGLGRDAHKRRPQLLHRGADLVDFHKLLRRQQALRHQATVDQLRPGIAGWRDDVAAAEPGIAPPRIGLPACFQLGAADGKEVAGIKAEGLEAGRRGADRVHLCRRRDRFWWRGEAALGRRRASF